MKEINTVICGDNVEVMKSFEDGCIDLTVTSPPYDNLRDYDGYSFDFESLANELYRVTKDGGVVVWVVSDAVINGSESGTSFKQALYFKEIGFNLHDTMVYQKNSYPFPPSNRYFGVFEFMFIISKGSPKTFNPIRVPTVGVPHKSSSQRNADGTIVAMEYATGKEDRIKENVWVYNVGNGHSSADKSAFEHPAIFPEKLAQDHIYSWSNEGDVVLDPFNGSGTTTKMAKHLSRKYIGIELSQKYCDIANERLKQDLLF